MVNCFCSVGAIILTPAFYKCTTHRNERIHIRPLPWFYFFFSPFFFLLSFFLSFFESWRTPAWCFDYRSMTELLALSYSLDICSTICLWCQLTWIQRAIQWFTHFPLLDSDSLTNINKHENIRGHKKNKPRNFIFNRLLHTNRRGGNHHNTSIVCRNRSNNNKQTWKFFLFEKQNKKKKKG